MTSFVSVNLMISSVYQTTRPSKTELTLVIWRTLQTKIMLTRLDPNLFSVPIKLTKRTTNKPSCAVEMILDDRQPNLAISRPLHPLVPLDQNTTSIEKVDMNIDYHGWLEIKKIKWKESREQRKKRRLSSMNMSHQSVDAAKLSISMQRNKHNHENIGVNSLFRKHENVLKRSHWQIIQLASSTVSGHFFAWIVADGIMFKVPISFPRVFFISILKHPLQKSFLEGVRARFFLMADLASFSLRLSLMKINSELKARNLQFILQIQKLRSCYFVTSGWYLNFIPWIALPR